MRERQEVGREGERGGERGEEREGECVQFHELVSEYSH